MSSMIYVEYSRDSESPNKVTDKKVVTVREYNKLKSLEWVNILNEEALIGEDDIRLAKEKEWSMYRSDIFESGILLPNGIGLPTHKTRWTYTHYGQFLCVFNIRVGVEVTFNLNSSSDIRNKLSYLYSLRDSNRLDPDDISELEERLRTYSNFEIGGNGSQSLAGVQEGVKRKKGQKYYTYEDGVKKEHIARGSSTHSTDAQKRAAENARKYAHTESAEKKRRKSISARSDGKILKEI